MAGASTFDSDAERSAIDAIDPADLTDEERRRRDKGIEEDEEIQRLKKEAWAAGPPPSLPGYFGEFG